MIIHIRGHQFTLSEPYRALHPLTPAEASALNNLRAENIRNSVSRLVNNAMNATPDQMLSADELLDLQNQISKYDASYSFKPRHEPKPRPSPLDEMTVTVARERAKLALINEGTSFTKDQWDELAAKLVNDSDVRDEAARRTTHLAKVANSTIEDLLG